jgi:hypothetical protein
MRGAGLEILARRAGAGPQGVTNAGIDFADAAFYRFRPLGAVEERLARAHW